MHLADDCQLVTDVRARQLRPQTRTLMSTEHPTVSDTGFLHLLQQEFRTQFAVRLTKSRLVILPVQAVAEDIFFGQSHHVRATSAS